MDNDDIPMQKKACHLFASAHFGWVIKKEFYEKGVSGYSVSADDRDSITALREAAENKEFDILLVFMFDRLGRIDYETPFVLKWFVEQGIEVWSVKEGQQTFDKHEDDLVNYIRFWTANVESKKTSQRVSTRLKQMVEDGMFIGGTLPFGYQWVETEQKNKRGDPIKKPSAIPEEAEIVKKIFDSTVNRNIGYSALAREINEKKITTHSGTAFKAETIKRILSNPLYCGYLVRGEATSPRHEELQIIDEDSYNKAQIIIQQRAERHAVKNSKEAQQSLLPDVVYCSSCGKKMIYTTTSGYRTDAKGNKRQYVYGRYICPGSALKRTDCKGQGTYSSNKLEKTVIAYLNMCFKMIKTVEQINKMKAKCRRKDKKLRYDIKILEEGLDTHQVRIKGLHRLLPLYLMGKCPFDVKDVSAAIHEEQVLISKMEQKQNKITAERKNNNTLLKAIARRYSYLLECASDFGSASNEQKREIIEDLIDYIKVGKGVGSKYDTEIHLSGTYKEFFSI
ncbi:recombinase family protein [Roseburia sp. MSJ-14]|nr:recombinase family protein [Roseburia sp. MSJ-14]